MIASLLSAAWARIHAVLIGVDDTALAVVAGTTDITISSRCGISLIDGMRKQWPHPEAMFFDDLGQGLDDLSKGHCFGAIVADLARAQQIVAVLTPYADYIKAAGLPVA